MRDMHKDDTGWKTGGKLSCLMGFVCRKEGNLLQSTIRFAITTEHVKCEVAEVVVEVLKRVLHVTYRPIQEL